MGKVVLWLALSGVGVAQCIGSFGEKSKAGRPSLHRADAVERYEGWRDSSFGRCEGAEALIPWADAVWGIMGVVMERRPTGLREEDNKNRGGSQ